jgi:alpha-galactosidase
VDESRREWTAQLAIPISAITEQFDPAQLWRVNFFRCEGIDPQRFYGAWQPTGTPRPNFHVPGVFGTLRFAE